MEYTFENANLAGIGFFDNETDRLVQFRGAVSDSAALTITLNAVDNTLVWAFDQDALVADIPDADTTTRGILETATNAEAVAKAATDKILTPSNLAVLGATDTFAGFVELATDAEAVLGVSSTLAVTPTGLAAKVILSNTVTWTDEVSRNGSTPVFDGQIGTQLDADLVFVASGTGVGDFDIPLLSLGSLNNEAPSPTKIDTNSNSFTITGGGSFILDSFGFVSSGADSFFNDATTFFGQNGGLPQTVDFANAVLQIANLPSPVESVVATNGSSEPIFQAISSFLSTSNVQTGYTTFANPATLRTCDTATVTLPQLAQLVGTLIEDLKGSLLPST